MAVWAWDVVHGRICELRSMPDGAAPHTRGMLMYIYICYASERASCFRIVSGYARAHTYIHTHTHTHVLCE